MSAIETLRSFNLSNLPDLDTVVIGALELLQTAELPSTTAPFRRPLVIGSGNAEAAGRILFGKNDAVFANESNYQDALDRVPDIDGAVLISASGGKHSIEIAQELQKCKLHSLLFTANQQAPAASYFASEDVYIFPKNREPYTYNTSTYLSMIIADTGEDAGEIKNFLEHSESNNFRHDLSTYHAFTFILPPQFGELKPMIRTKFDELFGVKVVGRVFSSEEIKHAKTVVKDDAELFVSIGVENTPYGEGRHRLSLPLPESGGYAAALATTYHFVGKIQSTHPAYFKERIAEYCQEASQLFGQPIDPIVE